MVRETVVSQLPWWERVAVMESSSTALAEVVAAVVVVEEAVPL